MSSVETPGATSLVARVKNILLTPGAEWARIDLEPATIQGPDVRIDAAPGEVYTPDTELAEFLEIEDIVRTQTVETITLRRARSSRRLAAG